MFSYISSVCRGEKKNSLNVLSHFLIMAWRCWIMLSPSFNVSFCFLCNWLPVFLRVRWSSLMVFFKLVRRSCVPSVFLFPICLPPAKQRAADWALPQQYPAGSRLGHNFHGVRQNYQTLVSVSPKDLSKAVPKGKSKLLRCSPVCPHNSHTTLQNKTA